MLRIFIFSILSLFCSQIFARDSADFGKTMLVSTKNFHNMAQVSQPKMDDVNKQAGTSMADRIRWTYNEANQCRDDNSDQTLCYIALAASEKSTMKQLAPAECPQGYESILRFGKAVRNKDVHTIPPQLLQYTPADVTNYVDQSAEAFYVAHDYSCDSIQTLKQNYNDDPDLLALLTKRVDVGGVVQAKAHGNPGRYNGYAAEPAGLPPRTAFTNAWSVREGLPIFILLNTSHNLVIDTSNCRGDSFEIGPDEFSTDPFGWAGKKVSPEFWCNDFKGIRRHPNYYSRWVLSEARYVHKYCARPAGYFPVPTQTSTATPLPVPDELNNPAPTVVMCAKKDASNAKTFWREVG